MKRRTSLLCLMSLMTITSLSWAETNKPPLKIGVAPHTSARVILEMYQPLRLYLQNSLATNVEILTAPDFTEFARRALHKNYDIAITTGHQARLLQVDAKFLPLITYKADFKAIVVAPLEIANKPISALRDQRVIGLSPSSLVTQWGLHWMNKNGLSETQVRYVSAADSVGALLLAGDAGLGMMSLANYQKLNPDTQSKIKIVAQSQPLAGRVYMLNPSYSSQFKAIQNALWAFSETNAGKEYFSKNKLDGYRAISNKELEEMEPYAKEVRQVLKQTTALR